MDKYVIYIGNFPLPDKGASSQRVISNAKIINSLGYKTLIVGFDKELGINEEKSFTFRGIDFIAHKHPSSTKQWIYSLLSIKKIKEIINNIQLSGNDVYSVIAYNYSAIALNRLIKYLKQSSIKCFADCTEWYDSAQHRGIKKVIKKIDTSFRMRYVQKKVDGLIVISTYLQKFYKNQNTILIPPLVDKEYLPKNVKLYDRFTISYCGSPFAKDKLDLIVDMANRDDICVDLVVAGVTKDQFIDQYNYQKPIFDNIKFLGRVSHDEALRIIAKSHYSCFFRNNSRKNNAGFATKFAESISVRTPVITNNTSDLFYWIEKLDAGIMVNDIEKIDITDFEINCKSYNKRISEANSLQFTCDNLEYINLFRVFFEN